VTSSLASPFGYAALEHVDYITFILAKSCKLLPTMALHVLLWRKKFPLYKYVVVVMVTIGISVFTIHDTASAAKAAKHAAKTANANKLYGLLLLSVNLLLDGLTNTVQDNIFTSYKPYAGSQMMCAMNILSTTLTTCYLLLAPFVASTPLGPLLKINGNELQEALDLIRARPQVGYDVLAFSMAGAMGQIAIYHTLSSFGSLILVTVTVTRKMLTMILSVVWFGHRITGMQWVGVGAVFGGIGGEAAMKYQEGVAKRRKSEARMLSEAGQDRKNAGARQEL
jgi:solute carrier family 35 (UDP-galactose transporter), member B1